MDAIKEWWVIISTVVAVIIGFARLQGQANRNSDDISNLKSQLSRFEDAHHKQALQLARIEESQSYIKKTLDRIYSQVSAQGSIQHYSGKTIPPGSDP